MADIGSEIGNALNGVFAGITSGPLAPLAAFAKAVADAIAQNRATMDPDIRRHWDLMILIPVQDAFIQIRNTAKAAGADIPDFKFDPLPSTLPRIGQ